MHSWSKNQQNNHQKSKNRTFIMAPPRVFSSTLTQPPRVIFSTEPYY